MSGDRLTTSQMARYYARSVGKRQAAHCDNRGAFLRSRFRGRAGRGGRVRWKAPGAKEEEPIPDITNQARDLYVCMVSTTRGFPDNLASTLNTRAQKRAVKDAERIVPNAANPSMPHRRAEEMVVNTKINCMLLMKSAL